jgi:hypothetical protein
MGGKKNQVEAEEKKRKPKILSIQDYKIEDGKIIYAV